ncbi:histidine phosphatase family protein [Thermasporomyces composti]|uniref:Putative phosphoglycerate mutase n=1 Tax=Thermasporomyces composti TaxID=696763 RepID=A0A3D9V2F2_THECX|nr:histidine phosphatase family protein [Thermasporomyces composti]REF35546.1 putative phosphoglycerate mutase [Thermasporomyces composti]
MPTSAQLWIVRHGETAWSRSRQLTSVTDLPLTEEGERAARAVGERLASTSFDLVLASPLRRALDTARLAGFGDRVRIEPDAHEWRYGAYEGRTTAEIRREIAGWSVWTHPVPGGETIADVAQRADRLIERIRRDVRERALLFAHGHFLRVLAARWVGLPPEVGAHLVLDVATVSVLGWEREAPAVVRWNT